jgi:type I restriction enzyme, S subunit
MKKVHYLLRTPSFATEAERWSYGITSDQWSLRPEHFKMIYCSLPSWDEQADIVRFLRHADQRIRRYILAKQKLIKLLDEQKQAVISEAITCGLDPSASLKPSGVEWIGEIPAHWAVIALGKASQSIQTGPFGSQLHAEDYATGGVPVINPSHMQDGRIVEDQAVAVSKQMADELGRHKLRVGDVVVARRGELGRCALVTERETGWLCGTGSLRIRPIPSCYSSDYLVQVFGSRGVRDMLSLSSIGATMDNLNAGMVARLRLPCPPVAEQRHIIHYINERSQETETTAETARSEITFLREYRIRLIADVVTGKLDVRQAAKQLPDQTEEPEDLPLADDVLEDGDGAELAEAEVVS